MRITTAGLSESKVDAKDLLRVWLIQSTCANPDARHWAGGESRVSTIEGSKIQSRSALFVTSNFLWGSSHRTPQEISASLIYYRLMCLCSQLTVIAFLDHDYELSSIGNGCWDLHVHREKQLPLWIFQVIGSTGLNMALLQTSIPLCLTFYTANNMLPPLTYKVLDSTAFMRGFLLMVLLKPRFFIRQKSAWHALIRKFNGRNCRIYLRKNFRRFPFH